MSLKGAVTCMASMRSHCAQAAESGAGDVLASLGAHTHLLLCQLMEHAVHREACVVHEDVQRSVPLHGPAHELCRKGCVQHVAWYACGLAALLSYPLCNLHKMLKLQRWWLSTHTISAAPALTSARPGLRRPPWRHAGQRAGLLQLQGPGLSLQQGGKVGTE